MNKNSRLAQTQICLIGADVRHLIVCQDCDSVKRAPHRVLIDLINQ